MLYKTDGVWQWWEFSLLAEQEGLFHGVFSRKSADFAPGVLDREKLKSFLGTDHLLVPNQRHGAHVEHFPHLTDNFDTHCDAVITDQRGAALMIQHADCQAAIFFDPKKRCVANAHCGWKGNIARIYTQVINQMREKFGSRPEDILVCISPSLGPSHAEFTNMEKEFPNEFWRYANEALHIDLWQVSYEELIRQGILSEHIEIAKMCTYSDEEHFFSYRRDKTKGRNATIVALV